MSFYYNQCYTPLPQPSFHSNFHQSHQKNTFHSNDLLAWWDYIHWMWDHGNVEGEVKHLIYLFSQWTNSSLPICLNCMGQALPCKRHAPFVNIPCCVWCIPLTCIVYTMIKFLESFITGYINCCTSFHKFNEKRLHSVP